MRLERISRRNFFGIIAAALSLPKMRPASGIIEIRPNACFIGPRESEYLEAKQFSTEEIARIFNVPLSMVL